jgi:uncharacterized protein
MKSAAAAALGGALWLAQPALAAPPAAIERPIEAQAGKAVDPHPALWLLADEDTRIYLFGTVHILPPELVWRSPEIDRVVAETDELVLEVAQDPSEAEVAALAPSMRLEPGVPILSRVSSDRREPLRRLIEGLGMSVEGFDGVQTWAAAMSIGVASLLQAYGQTADSTEELSGVEDALRIDFGRSGRPITGVETGAQQLGFLSRLAPGTQQAMLDELVDAYQAGDPEFGEPNEDDWLRGDVAAIAEEIDELPPELVDVLVRRRNTAWTSWLIERLDRPGTVLFAVGAAHLAGDLSVQNMLAARGFAVRRLN